METRNQIISAIILNSDWNFDQAEDEGKDEEIIFYRWNNEKDTEEWLVINFKVEAVP